VHVDEGVTIAGSCQPAFESVRTAFAGNFAAGNERGASVAMTLGGEPVVDLWSGQAGDDGSPWREDTIVNVYSSTKTMASLCVLMVADRGLLDLTAPVAEYWPEFAHNGKERVLVSHVMSHSAGLPGFDPPLSIGDLYDWERVCDNLEGQAPWWEPGTAFGYHALTQGYLQGELVRRVDGRSLGTFYAEEVARPLGADFHIGLDPRHDDRVADLVPPASPLAAEFADAPPGSLAARMLAGTPPLDGTEPRTREWRAAEIPAAGGIGNARSMARVHSALACGGEIDGVRLLSEDTLVGATEVQFDGTDALMNTPARFGMGFGLPSELIPFPNPRTLFWGGWGGSLCVIDLDAGMSLAYAMNRMDSLVMGDMRAVFLVIAAYTALAGA
jgi:CubicO group peptidase (beta-lactamase class C family)